MSGSRRSGGFRWRRAGRTRGGSLAIVAGKARGKRRRTSGLEARVAGRGGISTTSWTNAGRELPGFGRVFQETLCRSFVLRDRRGVFFHQEVPHEDLHDTDLLRAVPDSRRSGGLLVQSREGPDRADVRRHLRSDPDRRGSHRAEGLEAGTRLGSGGLRISIARVHLAVERRLDGRGGGAEREAVRGIADLHHAGREHRHDRASAETEAGGGLGCLLAGGG